MSGEADNAEMFAEIMRTQNALLQGIAVRQDQFEGGMREIIQTLHGLDKRLDRTENSSIARDVQRNHERINKHSSRLDVLEKRDAERTGAMSFARVLKDFGPVAITVIAVAIFYLLKGEIG